MDTMKRLFFAALALFFCLGLHAQMESRLSYRRYTTHDGLPQMQTERVWQDSRGYIYIGTLSGFVRFDGRGFTPFLKGRRENIVGFAETDGQVRALGFPRQWLIDYDDVTMCPIDPEGHWLLNNLNAGSLPDGYVLLEDEQEQHRRLCMVTRQGFEPLTSHELLDEMTPDRKLYVDSLGIVIPTAKGVFQIDSGWLSDRKDVYTLMRTEKGLLAFASDGIYDIGGGLIARADWDEAAFGLTVRRLKNGQLVIADEHTIYLYDGAGSVRRLFTGINLIRDVLVDRWDRLWVASYQGVYCFFNRCFTSHWLADVNDIARALAADSTGRLVLGTLNGKVISVWQQGKDSLQLLRDSDDEYYAPCGAAIGSEVFLSAGDDVACVDSSGTVLRLGLPQDRYRFMAVADGKLVLVTPRGISAFDPATRKLDTLTTQIPYAWCAAADGRGSLWVGTTLGLYQIGRGGSVSRYDLGRRRVVTAMAGDERRGCVFFASADSLLMIEQGRVGELDGLQPLLAGHEVRSLHVSPRGYLVVATLDGLLVARLTTNTEGHTMLGKTAFFDQTQGFTLLAPQQAAMAETADGTVWVAGLEQMISFRPAEVLAMGLTDTYIAPPLRWWQRWWVWLLALALLVAGVWRSTRWYEERRNRHNMIRLQREKLQREEQIEAIRQKAIEEQKASELAKDIVKMTEKSFEQRLSLRTASGSIMVDVKDIAYFKGDGNYSQIVTFQHTDTVLMGLGTLVKMLDPDTFVRADRSTLVNVHNICRLLPKQRRCVFRSPVTGQEVGTTLLAPAFKRLQALLA